MLKNNETFYEARITDPAIRKIAFRMQAEADNAAKTGVAG